MYIKTLSVVDLNKYIKKIMDSDYILRNISVEGEISNLKLQSSGHMYFSLKDSEAKINCVMFREKAEQINFIPENGMKVIVKGRVSVYLKEGAYQLYCDSLEVSGIGQLYEAFENMKKKLEKEGLFEEKHKRTLPVYPLKIGVITSPTGAALRDIINVVKRRNPNIDILVCPSLVQGQKASSDIIKALRYLESRVDIDVIILARGGGSLEELWCFNDENLAREIYKCCKPVITGVGHETDFTIVDFVSDRRAPTPSAAAEIVIPRSDELNNNLDYMKSLLIENMGYKINNCSNKVNNLFKNMNLYNPSNLIKNEYNRINSDCNKINIIMNYKLSLNKEKLARYRALITAHNPLDIIDKGYSLITTQDDKKVISTVSSLKNKASVNIRLKDGKAKFKISFMEEE